MGVCVDYSYAPSLHVSTGSSARVMCLGKEGSHIGTPTSIACCSAACRATRAPLWVSVGRAAVAEAVGAMLS